MIKKIFLLVSFSFFLVTINAQVCENLDAGDDIQMLCTDDSEVQLTAIVNNPNYKSTTDYSIGGELLCPSIPHEGARANLQTDDAWINFVLDMPFDFCFFGNQYDQLLVSANGVITFDTSVVGDFHVWLTETNELPDQIYQTNAIFGPYHDMDPSIQPRDDRIVAQTLGVAPNRTFVVSFECRQFNCNELESKSKIILYESSNVIDIFVEVKDICNTWEEGKGLVGIQNKFATVGYSPVGREQGAWTPTSGGELWRFMPNGEELDYTLTWFDTNDMNTPLNADNGEVINVTPQVETTYVVQLEYIDDCSDDLIFLQDTITITPGFTPDLAEPVDLTECEDPIGSGTFDFNIDQTTLVLNGLNPADFIISYHNSLDDANDNVDPILILNPYTASNETIYIRVEDINDATCVTLRLFNIIALPILDTSFTYNSANYCDNDTNPLPNAVANVATFTISNDGVIDPDTGEIDLAASGLGNDGTGIFIITHEINMCSTQPSQFQITIELSVDPSFDYPDTVCLSEVTNPTALNIITAGGIFTIDDNTVTINPTTGEIDLATVTANTIYTIFYSFGGNCPSEDSNTIEILDDDASFTYPNTNYCNDDVTNPLPTSVVSGGVYTINNGGVLIDNVTGEIDLAASALGGDNTGNFVVTYTITACGTSSEFSIIIEITEDASFQFPTEVCIDDANPTAFNVATTGGIFSVDLGASINTATGELDLTTTTAGTSYTISYDFGGNCPSGDTQTITIIAENDSSFDYATNLYCNDGTNPIAQNIATAGGTFSMTNGGVFDVNTGEINLSDSALGDDGTGVFVIMYTSPEPCSTNSEFTITIEITEDATFEFPNEVCIDDANPIAFNIATAGGIFSVDLGASINTATGELDLSTTTAGTSYTISYDFGGFCLSSETQTIIIVAEDDSSFDYTTNLYCNDGVNPLAQNIVTIGGIFTINNDGVIDLNTGEINLSDSALGYSGTGVFVITYTSPEPCSTNSEFTITIEITEDATFEFPMEVCIDDANPIAFNIATAGGIFTVNNGAAISATGELDLSTTTAGTMYTISYDLGGFCLSGETQTITIVAEDDSSFDYATNLYCNDGSINPFAQNIATAGGIFSMTNGGVFDVNTGEINLSDSALGDDGTGVFVMTYTTQDPCSTSSQFTITIQLTNDANFDYDSDICSAEENPVATNFIAGGIFSVDLGASINTATGELDLSTVTEDVTYTITYSFGGFCTSDESNQILINESPIVNIPTSDSILECDNGDGTANFDVSNLIDEISTTDTVTFYNSESDAINDTNSISSSPLVTNGLNVWVRVENVSGCFITQNVSEFLRVQQCFLVIPEGFSPNSDIIANQQFTIRLNNGESIETLYPDFKLFIYNRFGNEVYVGNASETDWNGTVDNDGEELPVGTYFYGIKLNDLNNITYRGWVYLQR